ncbi:hypothetical protein NMG60_11001610 [Bertholletia excelsa]
MAKNGASVTTPSEFEPHCHRVVEEHKTELVIHLPEFKKEQLKIKLTGRKLLISGERQVESKPTRFSKEIIVDEGYSRDGIRAHFSGGILYITMPKKRFSARQPPQPQAKEEPKPAPPPAAWTKPSGPESKDVEPESSVSRLKSFYKLATTGAMLVAMLFIGALIMYMYRLLYG